MYAYIINSSCVGCLEQLKMVNDIERERGRQGGRKRRTEGERERERRR